MILINFKTYKETFGDGAIKLAKIAKEVADEHKIRIVVATSTIDAIRVKQETGADVWLQSVDEFNEGKYSGWTSMKQSMQLGIRGSLLNHSERQRPKGTVQKIISGKPNGFEIMCCVKSLGQIEGWVDKLSPEWILYEPPELIASKDKSVATEKPEIIKNAVALVKNSKLIVGAGIKSKQDVEVCLKMGAKGVGLSSAFVLSKNPKEVLEEIAAGFNGII
ncbi:MAG: triose-phosphate isomerase [Candidatus Shapirobacteria bacterium]|jgi:triosephosphate isomerase